MPIPNTKVEIAFNAGYLTAPGSRTWTDVSAYVEASERVTIKRGRQDEVSQVPPSQLTLTLNNRDGRFTPEKTGGAYYPNVRLGRPIRVTVTHNAVDYVRFVGFIDDWLPGWPDGTDADSVSTLTAASRSKRLSKSRTMRSLIEEQVALNDPLAYYTMGDPEGSLSAADSSGNQAPAAMMLSNDGSGPDVTFGTATGPPGDELTAAQFAGGQDGDYLRADLGTSFDVIECYFLRNGNPITFPEAITSGSTASASIQMLIKTDGTLRIQLFSGGSAAEDVTGSPVVTDNATHHLLWRVSTGAVYLDGTLIDASNGQTLASPTIVTFGGSPTPSFSGSSATATLTGVVAHGAVLATLPSGADITALSEVGLTGFAGDLPGTRFTRYAAYGGVTEVTAGTGTASIGNTDPSGTSLVAALQAVADAEGGTYFDDRATSGLILRARDARYNLAPSFTLNATSQEVEADLAPKFDDQFLINEATATANGQPAGRVVDTASQDEFGVYDTTIETISDDVNEALAAAQWRVALGKEPRSRYSAVSVDVTNSSTAQATAVLSADIGTRFGLSGLPSQAPAATADLFAEGYEEQLSSASHRISFNTSPAAGYDVWTVEDPVLGAYDSNPLAY